MVYLSPEQHQYLALECGLKEEQVAQALAYLSLELSLAEIQVKAKAEGLALRFKQWFMLKILAAKTMSKIDLKARPFQGFQNHDAVWMADFFQTKVEAIRTCLTHPEQVSDILSQHPEKSRSALLNLVPEFLQDIRQDFWNHGQAVLKIGKQKLPEVLALEHEWSKNKTDISALHPHLLFKFFLLKKKAMLTLDFIHPQGKNRVSQALALALNWSNQGRPGDEWIAKAIEDVCSTIVMPILHRDLLAVLYDKMVDAYFDPLYFKLKQILHFAGIGEKSCLILYPHGRSGVMTMVFNASGELQDSWVFYPHAPDYNSEASLSDLARTLIKYQIADIGLVLKPETKKILMKTLGLLQQRYSDLSWQLHGIPGDYGTFFPLRDAKLPHAEDLQWFGPWLQNPKGLYSNLNLSGYLGDLAAVLPAKLCQDLWQELSQASYLARPQVFGFPKIDLELIQAKTLFLATLTSSTTYGLFLELASGTEGLLHVSNMGGLSPQELADAFKPGELIVVECLPYDVENKRISFKLPHARSKTPELNKPKLKAKKPVLKSEKVVTKPQVPGAMQMAFAKLKER